MNFAESSGSKHLIPTGQRINCRKRVMCRTGIVWPRGCDGEITENQDLSAMPRAKKSRPIAALEAAGTKKKRS